ncbi:hypothetical protein DPMN_175667 [Dreissena polymorpha]|uniref:Uncharacterized protein n=1 Tax=Dreissena polymorpha TaxID=45954 RepID=A0A9D4IIG6_DREPO|nr:hypothetical protein DPMN_175667 [Dreissena polymorpha]
MSSLDENGISRYKRDLQMKTGSPNEKGSDNQVNAGPCRSALVNAGQLRSMQVSSSHVTIEDN